MIPQTFTVALLFGLLALSRKDSGASIGVVVASALLWPEYLRIPIGPIETSVPRIIATVLIGGALIRGKHQVVPRCGVDHIVLILWGWTVFASFLAEGALSKHVTGMIGRGLDTVLMYFVVRYCVTSVENLKELARWLGLVAVIMGALGLVESITTRTPYDGMDAFRTWTWMPNKENQFRYGFLRAKGSTDVHIYFGMAMMLVTGMLWSINKGVPLGRLGRWTILFGILGALSSMSSGPWLGCVIMFVFGMYRIKPALIRPSLYMILAAMLLLEVASNRHFYNLIDYLALDPHTAWYRTRLLEIAADHLSDFAIIGAGSQWPNYWGQILDGRMHIDIVNHFLIVALYGGLPAMFLYITSHYLAVKYVIAFWKVEERLPLRFVAFNLVCVLLALDFSSLSVGLFGPPQILSYMLLGLIVSVTQMRQAPEPNKDKLSSGIRCNDGQSFTGTAMR